MVSILEIGAFITSLLAGYWGDKYGRRRTLFWGATIFTVGGVIQVGAESSLTRLNLVKKSPDGIYRR